MYVVMGATGHVGSAVAKTLLARREPVTILTRTADDAAAWRELGASIVEADVNDIASMRAAFQFATRAFVLNPPAAPDTDSSAVEQFTTSNILAALAGFRLERVVAASTYGARPQPGFGDLSTLWQLEDGLRQLPFPTAINRGAYYMTNWTALLDAVRRTQTLPSMFPADTLMPMVAPADLGRAAAFRLMASADDAKVRYVEGPQRYTPRDVADAFASILGHAVALEVTPREKIFPTYLQMGFSDAAAEAYAKMTLACLDEGFEQPPDVQRGSVELRDFIRSSVTNKESRNTSSAM